MMDNDKVAKVYPIYFDDLHSSSWIGLFHFLNLFDEKFRIHNNIL